MLGGLEAMRAVEGSNPAGVTLAVDCRGGDGWDAEVSLTAGVRGVLFSVNRLRKWPDVARCAAELRPVFEGLAAGGNVLMFCINAARRSGVFVCTVIVLHCITLYCIALDRKYCTCCIALHCIGWDRLGLQCVLLHYIGMDSIRLYCIAFDWKAIHSNPIQCNALQSIAHPIPYTYTHARTLPLVWHCIWMGLDCIVCIPLHCLE